MKWGKNAVGLLLLGLMGCQHTPPLTEGFVRDNGDITGDLCGFERRYLGGAPSPNRKLFEDSLKSTRRAEGDMIFLSGGSQHGAFGAGFLHEWQQRGGFPEFSVVTGISTGALQATGTFIGDTQLTKDGYTIGDEAEVLDAYVRGKDVESGLGLKAIRTLIRKGTLSDLEPLRERLQQTILTDQVLEKVAARSDPEGDLKRWLFAGVVDVDTGEAVALDLGEMARRFVIAKEGRDPRGKDKEFYRDCYIDALIASSSVPAAANPVFIDNRMYIDGGARFAVFSIADVGKVINDRSSNRETDRVYILLNGTDRFSFECGKEDERLCAANRYGLEGKRKKWSIVKLASRSVSILTDQVENLSVDRARMLSEAIRVGPSQIYYLTIDRPIRNDAGMVTGEVNSNAKLEHAFGGQNCAVWEAEDDDPRIGGDPLEFHPKYMKCLIDYGRQRASECDWNNRNENEVCPWIEPVTPANP